MGLIRGRRPFRDIVQRQLALFAADQSDLVARASQALAAYNADPDTAEAQKQYAEYDDAREDIRDGLLEMRDRYSWTMDESLQERYLREFDRQARQAYRDLIPELSFDDED